MRALRVLAERRARMKGPELAEAVGSTPGFVPQVISPLVRAGWVHSDPGPTGGYSLVADLRRVSMLSVIEAVEGPTDTGRCVLADRACNEDGACAMHTPWLRARAQLLRSLEKTSVAAAPLHEGAAAPLERAATRVLAPRRH